MNSKSKSTNTNNKSISKSTNKSTNKSTKSRRRKKSQQKKKIIIIVAVVIVLVLCLFLFTRKDKNPLIGKWTTEKGTIYEFNKDKTGKLAISIGEYEYTYEIKKDKLFVDFANESSTDTEFTFKIENGTLILESSNGRFTFKKID